ncbi:RxLR effector protein [Phytophthora megakarya]|uniref:RxLR effector protein n=1 Tax=Phytophthora megakarya TaxID=4795 RepID=A0A225WG77_9STRA|nr:RxLR effector protein [Phytophthora megakarya]
MQKHIIVVLAIVIFGVCTNANSALEQEHTSTTSSHLTRLTTTTRSLRTQAENIVNLSGFHGGTDNEERANAQTLSKLAVLKKRLEEFANLL